MGTRDFFKGLAAAVFIFIAYIYLHNLFRPPRPPVPMNLEPLETATQPAMTGAAQPAPATASAPVGSESSFAFAAGTSLEPVVIGGGMDDTLRAELSPRGAALLTLQLCERKKNGQYLHRVDAQSNAPYQLLSPLEQGGQEYASYETRWLWIQERNNEKWPLNDLVWEVAATAPDKAVFTTTLRSSQGEQLLRLTKSYELQPRSPLLGFSLAVENLSGRPLHISVEQDGPVGIHSEGSQAESRRLLAARWTGDRVEAENVQRPALIQTAKRPDNPDEVIRYSEPRKLGSAQDEHKFLWTALSNRYFVVFTRPLPWSGDYPAYVQLADAVAALPARQDDPGDLLARLTTKPLDVAPGASARIAFEIYAGPKDPQVLEKVNAAFVDVRKLGYQAAQAADTSCLCTFQPLPRIMAWLLDKIYLLVHNYGIAIIIMVLIVRTALHRLNVWQQKSMYKMQEAMGRVQPKMEAIKERYANDPVRRNQEIMKLWGEENVNPAAGMVSMIPLFIQMPILVALWTTLNTDVHLRNAPFDGWWIHDLSAPDALVHFPDGGFRIPLLGWHVASLNLLPILMGVSMWLQQKYMPKPKHVQERLEAAKNNPPAPRKPGQASPEDQLRQQQMMSNIMSVLFPIMFYNMPSGLNLYWMATNVYGIFESLRIRKQIDLEKQKRAQEGPKKNEPPKPGMVGRFFKRIAERAEELQRKADELSDGKKRR